MKLAIISIAAAGTLAALTTPAAAQQDGYVASQRFQDGPTVWQPNAYQRDAMTCYGSTGEVYTGSICAIGAATGRAFARCANGIGTPDGCFNENNEIVKILTNPRRAGRDFDRSLRKIRKRAFGF